MNAIPRRSLLLGGLGVAGAALLAGCTAPRRPMGMGTGTSTATTPGAEALPSASPLTPGASQRVVTATLTPRALTYDLGGVTASSWGYDDRLGGPLLRATAGDLLRVTVRNELPAETTVHWHGVRVRNVADGVPGITQPAIATGRSYTYEFTAPDPGTYFFHPHVGVQLDRGLYAPLIIDDPREAGGYDAEWIVVLDDWTDGVGKGPDDILAGYRAEHGTLGSGMGPGGMMGGARASSALGDAGDIDYPHYLINGRVPASPDALTAKPGQRLRLRVINAGSDTVFRVALGGHSLTITHTDGYPCVPATAQSFFIAMGERLDAIVTLGDGVFPLVARPEGKQGGALALVRTAAGAAPTTGVSVPELERTLLATQLRAAEEAQLAPRSPDTSVTTMLNGQMTPYVWGINGRVFGQDSPLEVGAGQRLRMRLTNMTSMVHPMHLHGHTWSLPGSGGLRKDTILVLPMQTVDADLQADNPGVWAYHCHNLYHAQMGMMTTLRYT